VTRRRLTLFDLDHTLLSGDSDVLWCEFLMEKGLLARDTFGARNAAMEARYRAGCVDAQEFAHFYLSTLAGRTPGSWHALRLEFLAGVIVPRLPADAVQLVRGHFDAGDLVLMTTATNRFITELTAAHLGIEHVLATEPELSGGIFTGRACGVLNMREGKVRRLSDWLAARGEQLAGFRSRAYSDSINDLPLLEAVDEPVTVDPDPRLAAVAVERGWPVLRLHGSAAQVPTQ
jgi:HAD superfamily hydrolase (TIGR01490 family)